ncbi:MAG TPA: hypothetical protein VHK26_00965, partial [Methyloceanibacter sp.]|nr:hypothetical protein [Methyloceanibacter sp.]
NADNLVLQRDLSISLNRLGDVKRDSGDTKGALAAYDESLAIRRQLALADPNNSQRKPTRPMCCNESAT